MKEVKNLCLLSLFIFLTTVVFAGSGPKIEAVGDVWDLGRIKKGDTGSKVFEIKNTGDEDLIIDEIRACCGYSVSNVSSWTIKPQDTVTATVACDTTRKSVGKDEKKITIGSNDSTQPELKITVRAYVAGTKGDEPKRIKVSAVLPPPSTTPQQINELIEEGAPVAFLDVREHSEYMRKHIADAISLPRSKFYKDPHLLDVLLKGVDKKTTLAVYCGGGFRSSYVAKKAKAKGYNAFNLEGGITAWLKQGLPVVEGPEIPTAIEPLKVNLEEAYEHYFMLFDDSVIWIDARQRQDFEKGHIERALNIPPEILEYHLEYLPRNKEIILYCESADCDASRTAARILIESGFKHPKVKVMDVGFVAWQEAGYPITP